MMKGEKAVMDPFTGAKSLPVAARLEVLNQEIRKLHRACTDAGYKPEKIREVADPVLKTARRGTFKKTARYSLYILLAGCLFAGLFYWGPTNYCIRVVSKKFMVYCVLPYYDWTWMFMNDCFWTNPYFDPPPEEISEDICVTCEELTELEPSYGVTNEDMTEKIYAFEPTIIADSIDNWRAMEQKINLDTIVELYATDKRTMSDGGISKTNFFRATKDVPEHIQDVTSLATWLHSEEGKGKEFTALWANNHTDSYKALHYWYTKPYFLPSMCEPLRTSNYVMISRRLGEKKGKGLAVKPRFSDMGLWIAQVYGRTEFILQPEKMCTKCKNLRFVLQQGHVLNVPIGLYNISQRPNSTESVAFGVGYEFQ